LICQRACILCWCVCVWVLQCEGADEDEASVSA
jgi:hypothetical protein